MSHLAKQVSRLMLGSLVMILSLGSSLVSAL